MKFLILKTSSLGDLIHAFPAVHRLRTHFPSPHTIDWLVEERYAELIEAHSEVDTVYKIHTKGSKYLAYQMLKKLPKYDVIFDLQGNIKSGLILSQLKSPRKIGFGFQTVSEWPNLLFTTERINPPPKQNVRDDLSYLIGRGLNIDKVTTKPPLLKNKTDFTPPLPGSVLVCPGSLWKNKRLPLPKLAAFIKKLPPKPIYILQGSNQELLEANELNALLGGEALILPKMPLPALQHFMDQLDLVIAMDSLPLHLAGTTSTELFSFFGPSLARTFAPERGRGFQGACPYNVSFERRCPHLRTCKTGACLSRDN